MSTFKDDGWRDALAVAAPSPPVDPRTDAIYCEYMAGYKAGLFFLSTLEKEKRDGKAKPTDE